MTPIFVGGCPRSGTTYVRNVIASHPDVTGLTAHDFGLADPGTRTLEGWIFHRKLSQSAVMQRWRAATLNCKTRFLVEKTPANALVFHTIRNWFPGARLVRVVRGKSATVSSIRRASSWAELPDTRARAEALYDRYDRVKCGLEVDYDELRTRPEVRAQLYQDLGLYAWTGPISNPEGVPGSKG